MRTASRTRTLPSETGCRRSTDAHRTASAPRSVAQRATLPMHRDLAEVARHVAECEPLRIRSRTETDALPADVPGQLRTAPRPVAVAPQPHRDLADANRKPHANAPQRDRLPTFNRCAPHRIRTEVGCPACNVADAPRPGRGSAARCRMRTATHPQPHRDRRAACRRSWSTANRTETGCRSTAAAPRRCAQAARERSPARPVADVQPMRTAPHPQPHRDLADANRKPHANAPQRDRLPTFNRCAPHRIRTEVGCPACNVADAPRPGRGSAARCRMRTATHPQPHRDRRAACRLVNSGCRRDLADANRNRTETGCPA
jgi:hypothetical protein